MNRFMDKVTQNTLHKLIPIVFNEMKQIDKEQRCHLGAGSW